MIAKVAMIIFFGAFALQYLTPVPSVILAVAAGVAAIALIVGA